MKKVFGKIITGFFVVIFGLFWIFTTKTCTIPLEYTISILDSKGTKQMKAGLRTSFKKQEVAYSFIKEYEKKFPELKFVLDYKTPKIKRKIISKIISYR